MRNVVFVGVLAGSFSISFTMVIMLRLKNLFEMSGHPPVFAASK